MLMEFWGILVIFLIIIGVVIALSTAYENKRTKQLTEIAQSLAMNFTAKDENKEFFHYLKGFRLMKMGSSRTVYNIFDGASEHFNMKMFDYQYNVGGGKSSSTYNQTVMLIEFNQLELPTFKMKPENFFHRVSNAFGMQDIDFEDYPEFSKQYLLQGQNEAAIRQVFNAELLLFFTVHKGLCLETDNNKLLIYRHGKRISPEEIRSFLEKNLALANILLQ